MIQKLEYDSIKDYDRFQLYFTVIEAYLVNIRQSPQRVEPKSMLITIKSKVHNYTKVTAHLCKVQSELYCDSIDLRYIELDFKCTF